MVMKLFTTSTPGSFRNASATRAAYHGYP
jgi:hypothetical protein